MEGCIIRRLGHQRVVQYSVKNRLMSKSYMVSCFLRDMETYFLFCFFFRSLFDSESILVGVTQLSNETLTVEVAMKLSPSVKGKAIT